MPALIVMIAIDVALAMHVIQVAEFAVQFVSAAYRCGFLVRVA
jgi:hypothetical protein